MGQLGKQNDKGERKKEENYTKNEGKGLNNAFFWAINSKKFRPPDPPPPLPQTYL